MTSYNSNIAVNHSQIGPWIWEDRAMGSTRHNMEQPSCSMVAPSTAQHREGKRAGRRRQSKTARKTNRPSTGLEQVSRLNALGEMVTTLIHELNQPLACINLYTRGCIQRVQAGTVSPEDLCDVLNRVAREAKRAGEIIQSVRNFIRNGRLTLARIQPNKLVYDAMSVVQLEAEQAGISIALDLAPDLPAVMADRVQIEQVLLNLLRNGLEALRECLDCEHRQVVRTIGRTDGYVEISVTDSGPGLSAEARAHVLNTFYTSKPQGMGLGLAMSGFVVRKHGGHLWVESEEKVGTTFYFTLPISDE